MPSLDPDRALALVVEHTPAGTAREASLEQACGLVLAEDVVSDRDYPPFARAMMDGYAVRLADAGRRVSVGGVVAAGQDPQALGQKVEDGQVVEIMTGAPCPPGTEAVVMVEEVDGDDEAVRLPQAIRAGQHIAPRGSDCAASTVVLKAGEALTALGIAVLASFGRTTVRVLAPPSLAIIATGNEIVSNDGPAGAVELRDANGPMLAAQARALGLQAALDRARDSVEAIAQALARAAEADIVLLSGGVSAGRYDLVPAALVGARAEVIFHGVAQKPGKPLLFARTGRQLLFGLPGNPLGSHFCFHRYVAASVRRWLGLPALPVPETARLATALDRLPERTLFQPARVEPDERGEDGAERWKAMPASARSSADPFGAAHANAYLRVPPGERSVPAGTQVGFAWIGGAR
jgi:molybdenum cofactor synthesis domain-containing protein